MSNTENNSVFHYTLHQRLWNHLADNPGMDKKKAIFDIFTEEERKAFGATKCTACEYARSEKDRTNLFMYCDKCPLDTSNIQIDDLDNHIQRSSGCLNGIYGTWSLFGSLIVCDGCRKTYKLTLEESKELQSKYAKMIANLPVKEGVPFD